MKVRQRRADGSRAELALESPPFAVGGAGRIHRVEGSPHLVAKVYHTPSDPPRRRAKLEAMLAAPPRLPDAEYRGKRYAQIAWPTAVLEDDAGELLGYVMPSVDLSEAASLEALLSRKSRKAFGLEEAYGYRVSAAANVAAIVAELHELSHHVIDLKPVNIHVYRGSYFVAMLDCDGFSIAGAAGERFPGHQYTEGYISPEALKNRVSPERLGVEQDLFALGVVMFQLLNQGLHPYQGRPSRGAVVSSTNNERVMEGHYAYGRAASRVVEPSPWSLHHFFDDPTRQLFDRAFGEAACRPSAAEWRDHLRAYADPRTRKLRICSRDSTHAHFSSGCGLCALEDARKGGIADAPRPGAARPQWAPPELSSKRRPDFVAAGLERSALWQDLKGLVLLGGMSLVVAGGSSLLVLRAYVDLDRGEEPRSSPARAADPAVPLHVSHLRVLAKVDPLAAGDQAERYLLKNPETPFRGELEEIVRKASSMRAYPPPGVAASEPPPGGEGTP